MARLAVTRETLIALFAKSGNVCAFPACTHELVTPRNLFVGQICHIEAANPGGPRYRAIATDEERRSFGNLLILCYRHHKETDDAEAFDTRALVEMKHRHERQCGREPFNVNKTLLDRLESEMQSYWTGIVTANELRHAAGDLAVKLSVGAVASGQFSGIAKSVSRLSEILTDFAEKDSTLNEEIRSHLLSLGYDVSPYDAVPYYMNPFFNRNWEMHALAVNNTLTDLVVALKQAEVRFLEEYVKTHTSESNVIVALDAAKAALHEMAVSAGYAD